MTPRLSLRGISKRYASVVANDSVSLDVLPGEIVALLGENGAGKSTLMKIVYGIVQPDAGTIAIDGVVTNINTPQRVRSLGIAMVLQQFALFESLTVLENVALGLPSASMRTTESRLLELSRQYGLDIDAAQRVHDLSVGERQRIEVVRALLGQPRLLILDEPTSVLAPQAIDALFDMLRRLAADGVSIVFISHKLHEIRRLAERCAVMRNGRIVTIVDPRTTDEAQLARLMLGDEPPALAAHDTPPGSVALRVRGLTVKNWNDAVSLHDVSLDVRSGEIVGIAGISGNGQRTLMAALAGEQTIKATDVHLFDQPIGALGSAQRRRLGIRYVPEQRLGHAAVADMTLASNALLTDDSSQSHAFLRVDDATAAADRITQAFGIHNGAPSTRAEALSGGNLQKYIVGREVLRAPRVLLVSQPTAGIDAGAEASIRNALIELRSKGCAVLVVSEDLDELYELCDRFYVISNGRLSPSTLPQRIDRAELGRWMAGKWPTQSTDLVAETA